MICIGIAQVKIREACNKIWLRAETKKITSTDLITCVVDEYYFIVWGFPMLYHLQIVHLFFNQTVTNRSVEPNAVHIRKSELHRLRFTGFSLWRSNQQGTTWCLFYTTMDYLGLVLLRRLSMSLFQFRSTCVGITLYLIVSGVNSGVMVLWSQRFL